MNDMALPQADRATAVEPVPVSPLRDGIPSAEATAMWRNGITNTVAMIDIVRFGVGTRSRRSKAFREFDDRLDEVLQAWFDATRQARPTSYEDAEAVFKATHLRAQAMSARQGHDRDGCGAKPASAVA